MSIQTMLATYLYFVVRNVLECQDIADFGSVWGTLIAETLLD
jgi:hypothetical protein